MKKRKDNKGRILKDGEYQRATGQYEYRYTDSFSGKKRSVYAWRLNETDGVPEGKKVILYAPTFRDNKHDGSGYVYDTHLDFDRLRSSLGDEYVVLFRAQSQTSHALSIRSLRRAAQEQQLRQQPQRKHLQQRKHPLQKKHPQQSNDQVTMERFFGLSALRMTFNMLS